VRTDPTDNGGLFIGRRPGTAPVRYRAIPKLGGKGRRRLDKAISFLLLLLMTVVGLSFWGPIPVGWLWIGSQVDYLSGSVFLGIVVAFIGVTLTLFAALVVLRQLDDLWILIRRAAGYDQRTGVLVRIFAVTCALGTTIFVGWLLLVAETAPL
jgi:divalent metal cation (Fe/Co/Zn/Cd) transporter